MSLLARFLPKRQEVKAAYVEDGGPLQAVRLPDGRTVYVRAILQATPDSIIAIDASGSVVKLPLAAKARAR